MQWIAVVALLAVGLLQTARSEIPKLGTLRDYRNRFMSYEHIELEECPYKYLLPVYSDYCHVALISNQKQVCLGALVYDSHILTTSGCVSGELSDLKVSLHSKFYLPIVSKVVYPNHKGLNILEEDVPVLLRINTTVALPSDNTATCLWSLDNPISYARVQELAFDEPLGKVLQNTTVCTATGHTGCLNKTLESWCLRKPKNSILQIREVEKYDMHPMIVSMFCDVNQRAVPVSSYSEWIRETIANSRIVFRIPFTGVGEKCKTHDEVEGVCSKIDTCPGVLQMLKNKEKQPKISDCGFEGKDMLACCTTQDMVKSDASLPQLNAIMHEIESCHELYEEFRRTVKEQQLYSQLALIHSDEDVVICSATVIARSYLLTTAQCALQIDPLKHMVKLGVSEKDNTILQTRTIKAIIKHPKFDPKENYFNIALLRMDVPILVNEHTLPVCLWENSDKMPVHLETIGYNSQQHDIRTAKVVPMYYVDCRLQHYHNLTLTEACVLPAAAEGCERRASTCEESGTGMYGNIFTGSEWKPVTYLIGMYNSGRKCDQQGVAIYTRISEYYHWIKKELYLDVQG